MKNDWEKIGIYDVLGSKRTIYRYKGTGHFPEVISRLQHKVGKIPYIDEAYKIIHLKAEQEEGLC